MSRKRSQRRRRRLWEDDPSCRFCGVETVLPEDLPSLKGRPPAHMATLEHLDSRYSPERGCRAGEERTTLSCWQCNNERGQKEEAGVPLEELWRRSGRAPQEAPPDYRSAGTLP